MIETILKILAIFIFSTGFFVAYCVYETSFKPQKSSRIKEKKNQENLEVKVKTNDVITFIIAIFAIAASLYVWICM